MKFNSNSQICTNEVQSKRLLALGLKEETADMSYQVKFFDPFPQHLIDCTPTLLTYPPINNERFIPAWSLHRLIEMMPTIVNPIRNLFVSNKSVEYQMSEGRTTHIFDSENNVYDNIINCIEWLIKEGDFDKEYLKE